MTAAAATAFQDPGTLILSNDALDLQQQVILGRAADRAVEEDDLGPGAAEFLNQQHLMGIAPRQPIGGKDVEAIEQAAAAASRSRSKAGRRRLAPL